MWERSAVKKVLPIYSVTGMGIELYLVLVGSHNTKLNLPYNTRVASVSE